MAGACDKTNLINQESLKRAFDSLDTNGDGTLELEEIKHRFSYTNYEDLTKLTVGEDFWPQLLQEFDTTGQDGKIAFNQFK